MTPPDAARVAAVLLHLGVPDAPRLGAGNEAVVHALDGERVVRVLGADGDVAHLHRVSALADELRPRAAYALPQLLDTGEVGGSTYAVERRLEGVSVLDALPTAPDRAALVTAYLDAVGTLGTLPLRPRPYVGDLLGEVRSDTWRGWLVARAARGRAGVDTVDPDALADAVLDELPPPHPTGFLHLDAFPGNVLTDGTRVTAVIDLGPTSAVGDSRLDVVASAAYLDAPITPTASDQDRATARQWLHERGLAHALVPVRRWLAAYWAWAVDDAPLHAWCRENLATR